MTEERMTRSEREDLQRLIRQREKVQKSAAKERSAQLLAEFENQMSAMYRPDDDPIWEDAKQAAERDVAKAQKVIAARCREMGIPPDFAPELHASWYNRGMNAIRERRAALPQRHRLMPLDAVPSWKSRRRASRPKPDWLWLVSHLRRPLLSWRACPRSKV